MAGIDLVAFERALADEVEARVADLAADIATLYEQEAPRESGTLASAFRYEITPGGAGASMHGEVDDDLAPHGKFIDQPVDLIVPVQAKALHWFGAGGGDVFAQRVVPSREHEGWWQRFIDRFVAEVIH